MTPLLSYQWTTAIIGLMIAVVIFFLIRRDILHVKRSLWWIGIALLIVFMGFFPLQFAQFGVLLGVNYPPILILTVGMGFVLIKILSMDLERSRQERMLRRLNPENSNDRGFPERVERRGKDRIEGHKTKKLDDTDNHSGS